MNWFVFGFVCGRGGCRKNARARLVFGLVLLVGLLHCEESQDGVGFLLEVAKRRALFSVRVLVIGPGGTGFSSLR